MLGVVSIKIINTFFLMSTQSHFRNYIRTRYPNYCKTIGTGNRPQGHPRLRQWLCPQIGSMGKIISHPIRRWGKSVQSPTTNHTMGMFQPPNTVCIKRPCWLFWMVLFIVFSRFFKFLALDLVLILLALHEHWLQDQNFSLK